MDGRPSISQNWCEQNTVINIAVYLFHETWHWTHLQWSMHVILCNHVFFLLRGNMRWPLLGLNWLQVSLKRQKKWAQHILQGIIWSKTIITLCNLFVLALDYEIYPVYSALQKHWNSGTIGAILPLYATTMEAIKMWLKCKTFRIKSRGLIKILH